MVLSSLDTRLTLRPERTGFNMYADNTQQQLTSLHYYLALRPKQTNIKGKIVTLDFRVAEWQMNSLNLTLIKNE